MSPARPIAFLSDYGLEDEFVGVCHAVMNEISPDSTVIDLTHSVPPQDVLAGALYLRRAISYVPTDGVILAVVDPGVGTRRRSIAVGTAEYDVMVGPDNGLLSLAWAARGGPLRAVEITSRDVLLEPVSPTFHGRDVFAPAAAHVAAGLAIETLGPAIDLDSLVALTLPEPTIRDGRIDCEVLLVDRFGNIQLSAGAQDLAQAGLGDEQRLSLGSKDNAVSVRRATKFGDVPEGELGLIVDSAGWLAIVRNRASAAEALGLERGEFVTVRRGEA